MQIVRGVDMKTLISMKDEEIHAKMRAAFQAVTQNTVSGKQAYEWMKQNGLATIHLNIADVADNDEMLIKALSNPEETIVAHVVSTFAFKQAQMCLEAAGINPSDSLDYAEKLQDIAVPLVGDIISELESTGFCPTPS